MRVLLELLIRHLLSSIWLPECHCIPWFVSIREWTHRIFSFVRSEDNSITSYLGSILKAPWALPFRLHQMHRCLFIYISLYIWSVLIFYYISFIHNRIFFQYIRWSYFSLSLMCFLMFIIHIFYHFWDENGGSLNILAYLIHLNRESKHRH